MGTVLGTEQNRKISAGISRNEFLYSIRTDITHCTEKEKERESRQKTHTHTHTHTHTLQIKQSISV